MLAGHAGVGVIVDSGFLLGRSGEHGNEGDILPDIGQSEVNFVTHLLHCWQDKLFEAIPSVWTFGPGEIVSI
jgi:hypothetical protein